MSNDNNAATLQDSGSSADENFSSKPVDDISNSCSCDKKTWIEIELVGEDDKPIPKEKYVIELPDGAKKEGVLDDEGKARVEEIENKNCRVSFPDMDQEAWEGI